MACQGEGHSSLATGGAPRATPLGEQGRNPIVEATLKPRGHPIPAGCSREHPAAGAGPGCFQPRRAGCGHLRPPSARRAAMSFSSGPYLGLRLPLPTLAGCDRTGTCPPGCPDPDGELRGHRDPAGSTIPTCPKPLRSASEPRALPPLPPPGGSAVPPIEKCPVLGSPPNHVQLQGTGSQSSSPRSLGAGGGGRESAAGNPRGMDWGPRHEALHKPRRHCSASRARGAGMGTGIGGKEIWAPG